MSSLTKAYAALVLYQMIMALWAVIGSKSIAEETSTPIAAFLVGRHFLASCALASIGAYRHGVKSLMPIKADITRVFMAGFMAQYGSPMFYLYGMQFVAPTIGSIFDGPLIPLIVFVLAVGVGAERLPFSRYGKLMVALALSLSSGGAAMVILASAEPESSTSNVERDSAMFVPAIIALALEALCLAASFILAKPLAKKYPLFPFAFWMSFSGFCSVALQLTLYEPSGLFGGVGLLVSACSRSSMYFGALLFNAFAISVVNTLCISFANATLPSSIVALGACIQPVFTLMLDVFLYGSPFYFTHFVALGFIASGIYLFNKHGANTSSQTLPSTQSFSRPLMQGQSNGLRSDHKFQR